MAHLHRTMRIDIVQNIVTVSRAGVPNPHNAWTSAAAAQGFSWRNGSEYSSLSIDVRAGLAGSVRKILRADEGLVVPAELVLDGVPA